MSDRLRIIIHDDKAWVQEDVPRELAEDAPAIGAYIQQMLARLASDPDRTVIPGLEGGDTDGTVPPTGDEK